MQRTEKTQVVMLSGQEGVRYLRDVLHAGAVICVLQPVATRVSSPFAPAGDRSSHQARPFSPRPGGTGRTGQVSPDEDGAVWTLGDLYISIPDRQVLKAGRPIPFTYLEFNVLSYLAANAGRVVTFDELIGNVWGFAHEGASDEIVKTCIYRLRKKLEDDPRRPRYIRSYRKLGYMFGSPNPR